MLGGNMFRDTAIRNLCLLILCISVAIILISCENDADMFGDDFDADYYEEGENQLIDDVDDVNPYIRIYLGTNINFHSVDGRQFPIVTRLQNYLEDTFPEQQFIFIQEGSHTAEKIGRSKIDEILRDGDPLPDIYIDFAHQMEYFLEKDLLGLDVLDYAGVYDIDINRFDAHLIEQMVFEGDGMLYGLPFTRSLHALVYNKNQFETFGIVPIDRPTWDDVLSWARELDLEYFFIEKLHLLHQLSLNYETLLDEVEDNDQMKNTFIALSENVNMFSSSIQPRYGFRFGEDTLALTNTTVGNVLETEEEWDFLAYPTFLESRGVGPDFVIEMVAISPHSEKIDVAFEIANALLSDEFQTELSRMGHGSPLVHPSIQQAFGADVPAYRGKNLAAFFQNRPSSVASYREEEVFSSERATWYMYQINQGEDAEEQWQEMITEIQDIFEE